MDTRQTLMAALVLTVGLSGAAQADLHDRGGGFVYDDVRDITWLQDANYAKTSGYDADGVMSYTDATNWASTLVLGGYDDWRLPSVLNQSSPEVCTRYNCTGSELGHLFYVTLGGSAGNPIPQSSFFKNIQLNAYWSLTEAPTYWSYLWFSMQDGYQAGPGSYQPNFYAWALRDGDVAAIPEPETYAMMLAGLGLVGFMAGRR